MAHLPNDLQDRALGACSAAAWLSMCISSTLADHHDAISTALAVQESDLQHCTLV